LSRFRNQSRAAGLGAHGLGDARDADADADAQFKVVAPCRHDLLFWRIRVLPSFKESTQECGREREREERERERERERVRERERERESVHACAGERDREFMRV